MADVKISGLPAATTPLAGTEVLPIVQSTTTKKVSVADVTAGRAVSALSLTATNLKTSPATANLDISGTTIAAGGSDANVDVNINAKGSGVAYLNQRWGVNQSGALVASAGNTYDIGNGTNNPRDVNIDRYAVMNALTASKTVFTDASKNLTTTGTVGTTQGGTGLTSFTANGVVYASSTSALTTGSGITFDGTNFATTGSTSAASFIPTSSTVPTSGMYLPASNEIAVSTNGVERQRYLSDGTILVGTTNIGFFNGSDIGIAFFGANGFIAASRNAAPSGIFNRYTSDGDVVEFRRSGSAVGAVNVTTTGTTYTSISDYRLKTVDGPLENSGAFIDALQPKVGTWKIDGSRFVGFIAHEVQEVSPSTVKGEKDAVDEEGNPIMQAMEYGSAEFIANIVAELQSLRKRVAQLEAK